MAPLDFSQGVPSQVRRGFRHVKAMHAVKNVDENRRSAYESLICLKIASILAEVKNPCCAVTLLIEINPIHGAFARITLLYSPFCLSAHFIPSSITIYSNMDILKISGTKAVKYGSRMQRTEKIRNEGSQEGKLLRVVSSGK
jgi:hypothetical protein